MVSSDQLPRMELTNTVKSHKLFTSCSQLHGFYILGYLWIVQPKSWIACS